MKKLLVYLKDYKKETVLAPLFKLLEASFELLVPLVMAAIIDTGIGNSDTGYILRMCMVLILLGIVGLVCSITAQYFAAKAAVGFAAKMKHALFGHIQSLSFTEMDTIGTPTLITRMTSDANQVQNGVNMVYVYKRQALRRLFLEKEIAYDATVMVGDRKFDMLGARERGLPAIGVAYGYAPEGELKACAPWAIASDVEELGRILRTPLGGVIL